MRKHPRPTDNEFIDRIPLVQRDQPRAWLLATQSCVWSETRIQVLAYLFCRQDEAQRRNIFPTGSGLVQ